MLELLTRYRIQPGTLILEVTESRRIDDPHAAVAILRPLRNAGVRVALDDFGMGYAGLRQLQHMKSLPIDVLKIDKMFVEGLPEDSSMIAAIIMLAQSLKPTNDCEAWRLKHNATGWQKRALVLPRASFLLAHSLLKSSKRVTGRKIATPN
ncbi:EAL domain-containing protein (plasmid) [Escherichia coli]|nr:EAL domain-containing protein [Escherichia coli]